MLSPDAASGSQTSSSPASHNNPNVPASKSAKIDDSNSKDGKERDSLSDTESSVTSLGSYKPRFLSPVQLNSFLKGVPQSSLFASEKKELGISAGIVSFFVGWLFVLLRKKSRRVVHSRAAAGAAWRFPCEAQIERSWRGTLMRCFSLSFLSPEKALFLDNSRQVRVEPIRLAEPEPSRSGRGWQWSPVSLKTKQ